MDTIVAPKVLHLLLGGLCHVIGFAVAQVQADFALDNLSLRTLKQLHQAQAGDGLAAAGLAHHAHGLADGNVKGYAVYALNRAGVCEEVGVEIVEFHRVLTVVHGGEVFALRARFCASAAFQTDW